MTLREKLKAFAHRNDARYPIETEEKVTTKRELTPQEQGDLRREFTQACKAAGLTDDNLQGEDLQRCLDIAREFTHKREQMEREKPSSP